MNPSSTSPMPSPASSSVSLRSSSHANSENSGEEPAVSSEEIDDRRPHAPVAKTLNKQEQKHCLTASPPNNQRDSINKELIPNLLHSGKFPPPPRSPNRLHTHSMSISPPPLFNVDLPLPSATTITSPAYIPAAPPGTPYTPFSKTDGFPSLPVSPHSPALHKLRPSPPPLGPPFPDHERSDHYAALLQQYQSAALSQEKARASSLQEHEAQYTTLEEYRHALARERRHALSLVRDLAYYKFNSRYQSCLLYGEAEINEEAKVNLLIKSMESVIKEKNEEKVRTVMELEREEERMINVLMERLERVNREKGMLERKIYGCGGVDSTMSRFERMEGVERVDVQKQFQSVGQMQAIQHPTKGDNDAVDPNNNAKQEFSGVQQIENDVGIAECEEDDDEAEGEDILEDKYHDPEMEMELDSLLEKKGIGK